MFKVRFAGKASRRPKLIAKHPINCIDDQSLSPLDIAEKTDTLRRQDHARKFVIGKNHGFFGTMRY